MTKNNRKMTKKFASDASSFILISYVLFNPSKKKSCRCGRNFFVSSGTMNFAETFAPPLLFVSSLFGFFVFVLFSLCSNFYQVFCFHWNQGKTRHSNQVYSDFPFLVLLTSLFSLCSDDYMPYFCILAQ